MSNTYIAILRNGERHQVQAKNKKDAKIKVERDFQHWLIGVREVLDMHSEQELQMVEIRFR